MRQQRGLPPDDKNAAAADGAAQPPPPPPRGLIMPVAEMAARFRLENAHGRAQQAELAAGPFPKERGHPGALPRAPYALTTCQALKAVTWRQALLVGRDRVVLRGRLMQVGAFLLVVCACASAQVVAEVTAWHVQWRAGHQHSLLQAAPHRQQVIVIGFLIGSLFYRMPGASLQEARTRLGAAFLIVMFISMGGMVQVAVVVATRSVWFKHRGAAFYPAWTHGAAMALSQVPVTLLEVLFFGAITYWMVGLAAEAARFFSFLAVLAAASLAVSSVFRLLAVAVRSPAMMNTVAGFILLILILTSGFTIGARFTFLDACLGREGGVSWGGRLAGRLLGGCGMRAIML